MVRFLRIVKRKGLPVKSEVVRIIEDSISRLSKGPRLTSQTSITGDNVHVAKPRLPHKVPVLTVCSHDDHLKTLSAKK